MTKYRAALADYILDAAIVVIFSFLMAKVIFIIEPTLIALLS